MHIHYINRDTFLFPLPPKNYLINIKKKLFTCWPLRHVYKKIFPANIKKNLFAQWALGHFSLCLFYNLHFWTLL